MEKCKASEHRQVQVGPDRGFTGSVAHEPYTDENRAAHGNICITQECVVCGAQRSVNINGCHSEYSPWGPTLAKREAQERASAAAERERHEARCRKAAKEARVQVLSANHDGTINVRIADSPYQVMSLDAIREAAEQHDNGDGLVAIYTGMLLMAKDALRVKDAFRVRP